MSIDFYKVCRGCEFGAVRVLVFGFCVLLSEDLCCWFNLVRFNSVQFNLIQFSSGQLTIRVGNK